MDKLWNTIISKAIKNENLTTKELAQRMNISEAKVEKMISGKGRVSLDELYQLCEILKLDINEVFDLPNEEIDILLTDELQARVNEITRSIPKRKRPYFFKALLYLANAFKD